MDVDVLYTDPFYARYGPVFLKGQSSIDAGHRFVKEFYLQNGIIHNSIAHDDLTTTLIYRSITQK